jgi:hypothetical protein
MAEIKDAVTHFGVEHLRVMDSVVDDLDVDAALSSGRQIIDELLELGSTNAVGAVDCDGPLDGTSMHESLECLGHLLIVSRLGRFAELVGGALGIDASNDVVKLRGGEDAKVCVPHVENIKGGLEGVDQGWTGFASVTSEDDAGGAVFEVAQLADEFFVDQVLVRFSELVYLSVGKCRSVAFPFLL